MTKLKVYLGKKSLKKGLVESNYYVEPTPEFIAFISKDFDVLNTYTKHGNNILEFDTGFNEVGNVIEKVVADYIVDKLEVGQKHFVLELTDELKEKIQTEIDNFIKEQEEKKKIEEERKRKEEETKNKVSEILNSFTIIKKFEISGTELRITWNVNDFQPSEIGFKNYEELLSKIDDNKLWDILLKKIEVHTGYYKRRYSIIEKEYNELKEKYQELKNFIKKEGLKDDFFNFLVKQREKEELENIKEEIRDRYDFLEDDEDDDDY